MRDFSYIRNMNLYKVLKNKIDDLTDVSKNGVYMIYHTSKPDKVYIGSTFRTHHKKCRKGIYGRWIEHHSRLINDTHHSIKLQRFINKYGIDGLRFRVLWTCDDCLESEIRKLELEKINEYDSFKKGFNCSDETFHPSMSEKARLKSSERMKSKNPMKNKNTVKKMIETSYKNRVFEPVLVFTKTGKLVGEFKSITLAAEYLKRDYTNVFRACKGEVKTCADHIIIYKHEYNIELLDQRMGKINTRKKMSPESIKKRALSQSKKVRIYKDDFEEIFESILSASKKLKLDQGAVSRCCRGEYEQTKGYKCEFVSNEF